MTDVRVHEIPEDCYCGWLKHQNEVTWRMVSYDPHCPVHGWCQPALFDLYGAPGDMRVEFTS